MTTDLKGQVALVTGAGRGIGRAVARAIARAGAEVVCAARTQDEIDAVAREIGGAGGRAIALPVDLADEASILALFSEIDGRCGRLDIAINNAGIGRFARVADLPTEDIDAVIAVNLRGTLLCCREAMRRMIPRRSGTIVNVASVVGVKGYPNQSVYTATKHGVVGLTKSLAVEAQDHGIRASVILPGGVDTDMVVRARPDLSRDELLSPDDVAGAAMYLLSLSPRAAVDQIQIRRRGGSPF